MLRLDPVDLSAAASFLPQLEAHALVEAWAVCGGYPQHLLAWDQSASLDENLLRLAGSPSGLLAQGATDIVREAAGSAAGYARILGSIGRGRHKLSQIASEAGQRVEHPLEVLRRAGLVRRELPVGAPRGARATSYTIDDHYLRFWYAVLFADEQLVAGGQGAAVLDRRRGEIVRHIASAFEDAARLHAVRMSVAGELAPGSIIGRWWAVSGAQAEVDVLGLREGAATLVGEAKWTSAPVGVEILGRFAQLLEHVPRPAPGVERAIWARHGADPDVVRAGVRVFTPADMIHA